MISVVILTKNNEVTINSCVESVKWADEIIVLDSGSNDKTLEIIKKLENAKIYEKVLDDFSSQRNYGMSKCSGDWILFLDSDEVVDKELRDEILELTQDNNRNRVFEIGRKDVFMNKKIKYGETGKVRFIRLVNKNSGEWKGRVHEEFKTKKGIETRSLDGKIIHDHNIDVREYFDRINFYSDLRAEELFENKIKESLLKMSLWPIGKFFYNYFFKLGFLDGLAGFALAFLMSMHSFLVRVKLRQLWI